MTHHMTYEEAIDWIHSKLAFGIKPGLARMKWLLEELGNPQDKIRGIHVVGTNGKGSTVHYLQQILTQSGYHVGTFTSPYIVDFKERISLDGQMISEADFVALVNAVAPVVERLPLETNLEPATEFEVITTLMFYYFGVMHPVDVAAIEAGLGGLHDSTNVFTPLMVLCPSIGLDHQAILGKTYAEIAQQKIGVLKASVPLIYATDRADVVEVFEQKAEQLGSQSFLLGRDYAYYKTSTGFTFELLSHGQRKLGMPSEENKLLPSDNRLTDLTLGMPGEHQLSNASLVLMATLLLQKTYPKLSPEIVRRALAHSHWLGRTEFLKPNLMIDGAHNNESVEALVNVLQDEYADKTINILFAAIDTKPVEEMLTQLEGFASLTVTTFSYPNSLALDAYPESYDRIASFREWLERVDDTDETALYVITGSLYFISQVRQFILDMSSNQD